MECNTLNNEDEDEDEDEDYLTDDDSDSEVIIESKSNCNRSHWLVLIIIVILAFISQMLYNQFSYLSKVNFNLSDLKKSLPEQDDRFWNTQEAILNLSIQHNELSTIIYLYSEEMRDVTNNYLSKLANHLLKYFSYNGNGPIIVNSSELNSIGSKDYGIIIDTYSNMLTSKHIMIIHDFNKLRGSVARAFKFLCDEYMSTNSKKIFLFTIKMDKINPNVRIRQDVVHQILDESWSRELTVDELKPILSRVLGTVLTIQ